MFFRRLQERQLDRNRNLYFGMKLSLGKSYFENVSKKTYTTKCRQIVGKKRKKSVVVYHLDVFQKII